MAMRCGHPKQRLADRFDDEPPSRKAAKRREASAANDQRQLGQGQRLHQAIDLELGPVKVAQQMIAQHGRHALTILTGGWVSDARLANSTTVVKTSLLAGNAELRFWI